MRVLKVDTIPYHTCDSIDQESVEFFLQHWQWHGRHVLLLGESLALDGWVKSWRAFYTASGKLVASWKRCNELFGEFGFGIEDVWFTNLCKCILGKERGLLKSCALKCASHLLKQIEYCKPRLIIVLGKHTFEVFSKMYGLSVGFGDVVSVVIWGEKYQIFSLYHPSPIHPKSKEWNKELIRKYRDKVSDVL